MQLEGALKSSNKRRLFQFYVILGGPIKAPIMTKAENGTYTILDLSGENMPTQSNVQVKMTDLIKNSYIIHKLQSFSLINIHM